MLTDFIIDLFVLDLPLSVIREKARRVSTGRLRGT